MNKKGLFKWIWHLIKAVIGIALLYALWRAGILEGCWQAFRNGDWSWLRW